MTDLTDLVAQITEWQASPEGKATSLVTDLMTAASELRLMSLDPNVRHHVERELADIEFTHGTLGRLLDAVRPRQEAAE